MDHVADGLHVVVAMNSCRKGVTLLLVYSYSFIVPNLLLMFILGQKRYSEESEAISCSKHPRKEGGTSDTEVNRSKPIMFHASQGIECTYGMLCNTLYSDF